MDAKSQCLVKSMDSNTDQYVKEKNVNICKNPGRERKSGPFRSINCLYLPSMCLRTPLGQSSSVTPPR